MIRTIIRQLINAIETYTAAHVYSQKIADILITYNTYLECLSMNERELCKVLADELILKHKDSLFMLDKLYVNVGELLLQYT